MVSERSSLLLSEASGPTASVRLRRIKNEDGVERRSNNCGSADFRVIHRGTGEFKENMSWLISEISFLEVRNLSQVSQEQAISKLVSQIRGEVGELPQKLQLQLVSCRIVYLGFLLEVAPSSQGDQHRARPFDRHLYMRPAEGPKEGAAVVGDNERQM